jgi:predicted O-methyltransferase YrrM
MKGLTIRMNWLDEHHLRVGEVEFVLDINPAAFDSTRSEPHRFPLVKPKAMVELFLERVPHDGVDNVVDLGIFKGGSTVLYNELLSPRRLVSIELNHNRVPGLDEYIRRHSLEDVIHLYYGTKQRDGARLTAIFNEEFGDRQIDLVVDDCSHRYEQSKASFNVLFPRVRPGGLFIIEDWGWAHWPAPNWQRSTNQYSEEQTSMSRLILELVMVTASRPGLVRKVEIDGAVAYVTRGDEAVSAAGFDIGESYLTAGRTILSDAAQDSGNAAARNDRGWLRRLSRGLPGA